MNLKVEFLKLKAIEKIVAIFFLFGILFIIFTAGREVLSLFKSEDTKIMECYNKFSNNPYQDGTGHYAGWEWSYDKQVSTCGGKSSSFIEGCEANLEARTKLRVCLNKAMD